MAGNRTNLYYLETLGNNPSALERSLAKINGVLSVNVDEEKKTVEYTIDEWSSDYDIFTEVMRICAEYGANIDFDHEPAESETVKEEAQEVVNEDAQEESVAEETQPEVEEESEEKEEKKEKTPLSERAQRVIELSLAIVAYIVSLFTTDITQYIFLAIAFAVAGYDALYEAFIKITKKQIFSEELIISIAFFASIFLGYAQYAVIALLLYSVVAFARKIIREEISKNPAFAQNSLTYTVVDGAGLKNVEYEKIEVGASVVCSQNSVIAFDGTLESDCEVEGFKGDKREAKAGESVYAGEKVLEDTQITVTAKGEDCEFGKYNKFINEGCNRKSGLVEKLQKNAQLYSICVFALCLLITFIPPIFAKSYSTGLIKWGYNAVIIAITSGLGFYIFSSEINLLSAFARGRKCKIGFAGMDSILKSAKAQKYFIDYENALCLNGEIKEDAKGAVRELKDAKITDVALVCSLNDEKAESVCKDLKIKEYYSRETQEEKNAELKKGVENNGVSVTTAKNFANVCDKNGSVVTFNCEKEGYNGDVCVASDEIAYLPYAVKLAKRTAKIEKANLILGFGVKAVILVLACLSLAELWWAVLADSIVSVICAVSAFINSKEIY